MHNKKYLVILAIMAVMIIPLVIISCSPGTPPPPVKETVVVKETVIVQPPPPTAAPLAPTAVPKPLPPVAKLEMVAMPGNIAAAGAITATVSYITETNPARSTVALYTNGLRNVPINVPVYLQVSAKDPKNSGAPTWTLVGKPPESKATIAAVTAITNTMVARFTPDVVGAYQIQVTLKNAAGLTSDPKFATFNAGTYIGADAGNCKQCHANKTEEWAKTPHATLLSRELDNQVDGPAGIQPVGGYITHYSETCTRCHSTGWYPPPFNGSGGYWDAKAKANWTFPTWKQIDEVFTKKSPSNFAAAPASVKNMGNIGCEVCHGPANEHVTKGAKVMAVSTDAGTCNQCHGAAANHSKGWQLGNSKHTTGTSFEEITGPARQACARCHGSEGFITFTMNPKNQAAWSNEEGNVGCATCHDPHSDATPFQLRVVGKPVEIPFELKKDVGLSAICFTCHNARTNPADAVKSTFPHYSSIAEMLSDTGGVTYGQTVPNSPHGTLVGVAPISSGLTAPGTAKFLFSSAGDNKGNVPGPCVTCHMNAIIGGNDPNAYSVFTTVHFLIQTIRRVETRLGCACLH